MDELTTLRTEVAYLRSLIAARRRGSVIIQHAQLDALWLVQQRYLGQGTGRVEASRVGIPKRRWAWAVALLRYSGVVSTRVGNWRYGLMWVADNEAHAIALLKDAHSVEVWQLRKIRREV